MENKKIQTPIAAILLAASVLLNLVRWDLRHIGVLGYASIAVDVFLCYVLFAKKRDNLLVIALGANCVMSLISLLTGFGIAPLLAFLVDAALLAYAIAVSEQTLLNVDFSQIKDLGDKFYYAPAVLSLLAGVITVINILTGALGLLGIAAVPMLFGSLIGIVLSCAYALTMASWLKDPYGKAAAPAAESGSAAGATGDANYGEAYCSLGKHIVLCLFTFGIWPLIWTYRTTKFLNNAPDVPYYNPTNKLLLCLFIPFYQIYWYYKHGQRIDAFSKAKGLNNSDMATLCLILGIFIPIVATILMQDRINSLCMAADAE